MVGRSVLSAAACGDLAAGSGSECLGAEVQREVGGEMDGERCDFIAVVLGYDAFVGRRPCGWWRLALRADTCESLKRARIWHGFWNAKEVVVLERPMV